MRNSYRKLHSYVKCCFVLFILQTKNSRKGNSKESDAGPPRVVCIKVSVDQRNVAVEMHSGQEDVKHKDFK